MRRIPEKIKKEMHEDPYYRVCVRLIDSTSQCGGRITWEHAWIYSGRQVNEKWAIIPLCERHHSIGAYMENGDMDKKVNKFIALNRIDHEYLRKHFSRRNWIQEYERLERHVSQKYSRVQVDNWRGTDRFRTGNG